jgi:hypothetical protein
MARVIDRLASSALTLVLLLAALAPAAALLSPSAANADANSEARVFFERANRQLAAALRLRGDRRTSGLEDALGSYVSSLRIVRSRNAVFNAGVTLQELGRADDAFDYFVEYKRMPGLTDAERAEVAARIDAMRPRLALVVIECVPPAEVRVDRRDLAVRGTTPIELAVSAGEHVVYLSAPGHDDAEQRVTAVTGQTAQLRVRLTPRPGSLRVLAPRDAVVTLDGAAIAANTVVPVQPGPHALRVSLAGRVLSERSVEILPGAPLVELDESRASAEGSGGPGQVEIAIDVVAHARIDGEPFGEGRRVVGSLSAGTHRLRVEAAGRLPYESTIAVQSDSRTRVEVTLGVDPETLTDLGAWPTVALVATTSVFTLGLVAGVVAGGLNSQYNSDLKDYDPSVSSQAAYDDLSTLRTQVLNLNGLADVLWVTAAAFGLTTLVLYLLDDGDPGGGSTGSVTVAPLAGAGLLGAALAWRTP